jgi:hypothetical protein
MATDVMAEFMGVAVDPVDEDVSTELVEVTGEIPRAGRVAEGRYGYVLDGRLNDSFHAVNLLLDAGVAVRRIERPDALGMSRGDFVVPRDAPGTLVAQVARRTGVFFAPLEVDPAQPSRPLGRQRIGVYQRYHGGNMDEGWTRWLLEQYGFPYRTLMDPELRRGRLRDSYDVIVLPADTLGRMLGDEGGGRDFEAEDSCARAAGW